MSTNVQFREFKSFNKYFFLYLSLLAFCAVVHLYIKHNVGNDSTISEWIINYQGGLTRRGFLGEICFHVAKLFNTELRFVIFIFQSSFFVFLSRCINFKNFSIEIFGGFTDRLDFFKIATIRLTSFSVNQPISNDNVADMTVPTATASQCSQVP